MQPVDHSKIVFSPYGVLNQDEIANDDHLIPIDWLPLESDPGATFEEKWERWFESVMDQLREYVWPTWDSAGRRWVSCPALDHATDLTLADFAVFELMERRRVSRGLDHLPDVPHRAPSAYSHRSLFIIEDDRSLVDDQPAPAFLSYYSLYDTKLDKALADQVSPLFFNSLRHKTRHTQYRVKTLLQRPRPYQAAVLCGHFHFVHETAKTGSTPSACSGHCLQGLIGLGGVYEYFKNSGIGMQYNAGTLQQYAVDIGDRRVMAGVHYPSDNISSWIILMNLAPRVFRDSSITGWLWEAISTKSFVYDAIRQYAATSAGAALRRPLHYLQSLAEEACAEQSRRSE